MSIRIDRLHPSVKHGAYSALDVLPGESRAAFEKLHRDLIAEYAPSGVHAPHILRKMARLIWRQQNLATLRISELAQRDWSEIPAIGEKVVRYKNRLSHLSQNKYVEIKNGEIKDVGIDKEIMEENIRAASQIVKKFGDAFDLVEIGGAATLDGLAKELEIHERLDAAINRCHKELLMVTGVKSVTAPPSADRKKPRDSTD